MAKMGGRPSRLSRPRETPHVGQMAPGLLTRHKDDGRLGRRARGRSSKSEKRMRSPRTGAKGLERRKRSRGKGGRRPEGTWVPQGPAREERAAREPGRPRTPPGTSDPVAFPGRVWGETGGRITCKQGSGAGQGTLGVVRAPKGPDREAGCAGGAGQAALSEAPWESRDRITGCMERTETRDLQKLVLPRPSIQASRLVDSSGKPTKTLGQDTAPRGDPSLLKLNNTQNSLSPLHEPHLQCPVSTCGWWPLYQIAEIQNLFMVRENPTSQRQQRPFSQENAEQRTETCPHITQ